MIQFRCWGAIDLGKVQSEVEPCNFLNLLIHSFIPSLGKY